VPSCVSFIPVDAAFLSSARKNLTHKRKVHAARACVLEPFALSGKQAKTAMRNTQQEEITMPNSPLLPASATKPAGASNVSSLHHSGSTAMSGLRPFRAELMDARLYQLYQNLAAINPPIGQVIAALNVCLRPHGWVIATIEDFEEFLMAAEAWGDAHE
jgi:hypothetical protein